MIVAITIVRLRNLFASAMLFAIYSLLCAGLFTVLDAGDVALTEAAVGAGISTLLMLGVLAVARHDEQPSPSHNLPALVVVVITGAALVSATWDLPPFGAADNPVHTHVAPYYIEQAYADTGVPNMVAAVLASYRSFDTIGEAFVILTAGLAVWSLLTVAPLRRRRRHEHADGSEEEEQ